MVALAKARLDVEVGVSGVKAVADPTKGARGAAVDADGDGDGDGDGDLDADDGAYGARYQPVCKELAPRD